MARGLDVARLIPEVRSLEVRNVLVSYRGGFRLEVEHLLFEPGLYALVGPNGAGKTTLLRLLAGLLAVRSGEVVVNDLVNIYGLPRRERLRLVRRHYSYLVQEDVLIGHLTVRDNILLYYHLTGEKPPLQTLERVTRDLGLKELLNRRPGKLSGGERRKVGIARALVKALSRASVVLMDEPTTSLDLESVETLKRYLNELAKDRIVVVATHDQELASIAGTRVELRAGRIIKTSS